jgi:hypothetical protein
VGADEAAGRLEAAEARHADVHEDEVGLLVREAGEHLLAARSGLDRSTPGTPATNWRSPSRTMRWSSQISTVVIGEPQVGRHGGG